MGELRQQPDRTPRGTGRPGRPLYVMHSTANITVQAMAYAKYVQVPQIRYAIKLDHTKPLAGLTITTSGPISMMRFADAVDSKGNPGVFQANRKAMSGSTLFLTYLMSRSSRFW